MHAFHVWHCLRTLRRTCATIATLRRPSSVDAAILKGALLRSCLAGRATRGRPRDISALATPASIVILAIVLRRIVRLLHDSAIIVDAEHLVIGHCYLANPREQPCLHFWIAPCTGSRSLGSNRTKIVNAGRGGRASPKSKIDTALDKAGDRVARA